MRLEKCIAGRGKRRTRLGKGELQDGERWQTKLEEGGLQDEERCWLRLWKSVLQDVGRGQTKLEKGVLQDWEGKREVGGIRYVARSRGRASPDLSLIVCDL